jgi:hypothetical protein
MRRDAMSVNLKKKPVSRTEDWQIKKDAEHFFVSSVMWWQTGTDLLEVLARQAKLDKGTGVKQCAVYKVPLPEDAPYEINFYAPQVEGAELVTVIEYGFKK